jgi:transposase
VKSVWAPRGKRPGCTMMTGTHHSSAVFGSMSIDGRQLFRQYDWFDGKNFLDFLKKAHRKFGRLYLFLDKAVQHYKTKAVREYIRGNRDTLRVGWIPTGCPEFNVMEECWRQLEKDLLYSRFYPKFSGLKNGISRYLRTKRFNLNMKKFLLTNRCG